MIRLLAAGGGAGGDEGPQVLRHHPGRHIQEQDRYQNQHKHTYCTLLEFLSTYFPVIDYWNEQKVKMKVLIAQT